MAFEGEKRGRWRRGRASDQVQDQWGSSEAVRGQSSIFKNQEETVLAKARRRRGGNRKAARWKAEASSDGGQGTGTERAVQLGTGLKVGEALDRHHKYI